MTEPKRTEKKFKYKPLFTAAVLDKTQKRTIEICNARDRVIEAAKKWHRLEGSPDTSLDITMKICTELNDSCHALQKLEKKGAK